MQAEVANPVMPDLLSVLREATGPSHEALDAAFGSLALDTRAGLTRFLAAHAAGLAPVFPAFRDYLEGTLGIACPDYPAMLRADLEALDADPGACPQTLAPLSAPVLPEGPGADAGIAYVVCGSRLGLAVIRQRGYWGEAQGFRSAYMTDGRGHEAWKALVPVLRTRDRAPAEVEAARAGALATFDLFARAFAATGPVAGPATREEPGAHG